MNRNTEQTRLSPFSATQFCVPVGVPVPVEEAEQALPKLKNQAPDFTAKDAKGAQGKGKNEA